MKKRYFVAQASFWRLLAQGHSFRQLTVQGFTRPGLGLLGLSLWMLLTLQPLRTMAQCNNVMLTSQMQVNNFPTRGCTTITGDLIITNSTITNLDGLSSLTSVVGNLRIVDNDNLTSVAGLSGLTRVGNNLRITGNGALPNLNGLNSLTQVGGAAGGDLRINNNDNLISVAGLSGLTRTGFDVQIIGNAILPNLTGLSSLTNVGGDLLIQDNPSLISVAGLSGLASVRFDVQISGNTILPNLTGLSNLTKIGGTGGGDLRIANNDNLASVAGLSGLASISFDLQIVNNQSLTSLTGLSSLTSIGGDLRINTNQQLSGCAITAICQFLANPPANVAISGNAAGCSSVSEIQTDCSPLSISQPPASSSVVCVGTPVSTSVGVSGNARSYQWYKDGASLGAAQQSSTLSLPGVQASDAGTYRVVVSNSVTSLTSTAFSLTVNPYPTATLASSGTLTCSQTSVTLTAAGGIDGATYQFSGGAQSGGPSSATVSVTNSGLYSVTVTNPGGCSAVANTTVESNTVAPQNLTLSSSGTLTCANTSVTLTATSSTQGVSYSFSSPGVTGSNGNTATVNQQGSYTVTVTGTNGCTATAVTTVSGSTTAPVVTLINSGPIADNNPTVTLTAGGGNAGETLSYAFGPGATQQGGPSGNIATVVSPGIYSVTVTAGNGCTGVASTTVTGAQNPATICRNGSAVIRVTATGTPVKYEWYKNTLNSPRMAEITNLQRGTATSSLTLTNQQVTANYYVRVTDQNGTAVVYGPFKVTVNMGCITSLGRLAAEEVELKITLLGNPLIGEQLRATVSGASGKALNMQLLDLSGKPVRTQQWQQAESEQRIEWNLGGHASGVYLLQATTPANDATPTQRHSLKVVKP